MLLHLVGGDFAQVVGLQKMRVAQRNALVVLGIKKCKRLIFPPGNNPREGDGIEYPRQTSQTGGASLEKSSDGLDIRY